MKQLTTIAIVLARTDYGEADRILTLLTPNHGKLRLMAKGVRRIKSKLAGGIELFSVSDITFIQGRSEIGTLISTRLLNHYGNIVQNIDRTLLGYDLIKTINKVTEDEPEAEYFDLLHESFKTLDDSAVSNMLVKAWFQAQLLKLGGHTPNLQTTVEGKKLDAGETYNFSFDDMAFFTRNNGSFTADHIKVMRLLFSDNSPKVLQQVNGLDKLLTLNAPLVHTIFRTHVRA